ncbi:hypothetical protein [Sphingomonas sp. 28-62-11]|uniref:hypothetical protein n=1 Tax=Sphingomonas sp. 28-62-11 TaxID=1970432 RepID=UPI0035A8E3D9
MRRFALAGMLVLGACTQAEPVGTRPDANDAQVNVSENGTADDGNGGDAEVGQTSTALVLSLAPDGLQLVEATSGKTYAIPFGTPEKDTVDRVAKARGDLVDKGGNDECGAGPIAYANFGGNVSLIFQEGKFAGWSVNDGGDSKITTLTGIGLGSTRKALEAAYAVTVEESSIGTEFSAGELSGLLNGKGPDAKVTDIWAGVTCIAR